MSTGRSDVGLIAGQAPVLRSSRIVLRPLHGHDASRIQNLLDDFEVVKWMGRIPHPYTVSDAVYFLEKVATAEISWGIEAVGEGLVGVGGFAFRSQSTDVEIGYWLGRSYWGRGYATEAAGLMLAHA